MLSPAGKSQTWVPYCCVLLAGCMTTAKPGSDAPDGQALSPEQLQAYFSNARDPRRYSITTYDSDDGPLFVGVNRLHHGQTASLPFQSPKSSLIPLVEFKGRLPEPRTALVDTTSKASWISISSAPSLNVFPLNPGHAMPPLQVKDTINGFASVSDKLRFDQMHMETVLLYVRGAKGRLDALARGQEDPEPEMVMGCDMLRSFEYVQLDFPNRRVVLSASTPYQPREEELMAGLPVQSVRGAMAVDGTVDGAPVRFLIDTAGAYEAALPDAPDTPIHQISLGDLVFLNVNALDTRTLRLGLEAHPHLGSELLGKYKLTIANQGRRLYFEKPESAEDTP